MAVDPAAPQPAAAVEEVFQPYVSDDVQMKEFTPKAIRGRGLLRAPLRRVDRLPRAEGRSHRLRVHPGGGAVDLGAQEARRLDHPGEQHRPDHRLGGREHRLGRGLHPAGVPVPGRRCPDPPEHRGSVLQLPRHLHPGRARRGARRPDDDPAAAGAHRQRAQEPAVSRRHGVRPGAGRRGKGRRDGRHRVPGLGLRRRLRGAPPGPEGHLGHSGLREPRHQPCLPGRHGERDHHPRVPRRGVHHRPGSPECWSPAACSRGSG